METKEPFFSHLDEVSENIRKSKLILENKERFSSKIIELATNYLSSNSL